MHDTQAPGPPTLRRTLGPVALTLYGLGNILGAGIYVLVGEVVGIAGYLTPLAFVVAACVAGLSAFCFGELSARLPVSAGEAAYVEAAFGAPRLALVVGLAVATAGLVSAATLSRGVVGYFHVLHEVPGALVIVVLVGALGALAAWGIRESVRVAAALTLVEAGGLLLVIAVAFAGDVSVDAPAGAFVPDGVAAMQAVAGAAFLAFFAFIGFEDMVNVAEEVRDPERNLPRAIVAALLVATALYLLVVLAALKVMGPASLGSSTAPLAEVYEAATGRSAYVLGVVGMLAVVNGVLVQLIMAARILYGMAARGLLPGALAVVSPRTRTPLRATALVTGVVLALALAIPLGVLARATSFIILAVFALLSLSLATLHRRGPAPAGVRQVPRWVPLAGLASALGLLFAQVLQAL